MTGHLQETLSPEAVFQERVPLRGKTTLKVGGQARYYAEPATVDDLRFLLKEAARLKVAPFILGRGSNLLALDGEIPCLVIQLRHPFWKRLERVDDLRLRVGAGLRLRELCIQAGNLGLGGFEFLEGIPGTVGGALRMNAGAMGGWMFDVVEEVRLVDLAGNEKVVRRDELHYGYRHCVELRDACAVEAVLRAPGKAETSAIREKIAGFQQHRYGSQPKEPSAGCIFKNPEGDSAGRLIDSLGLKGMAVGAAEVSRVHGNFIINTGGATSDEVVELVRRVRAEVRRQSGVLLEPEVLVLGADWEKLLQEGGIQ